MLKDRGVDIDGIEKVSGKTFHWEGEYTDSMNEAKTLKTELNVFAQFHPKLPEKYKSAEYVFLANIDPVLQMEVLAQVEKPKVVAADTMNFWIETKCEDLKKLIKKLDVLVINEGEAKLLTDQKNTIMACELISEMGPKAVVIKRGEYGFLLFIDHEYYALPAYPLKSIIDPTGAGDSFAGGLMGYLAKHDLALSPESLKAACLNGSLVASFTVQDFSVNALKELTINQLEQRHLDFKRVVSIS
jgi:sugar/nucleoside kinase (ribokinase family)